MVQTLERHTLEECLESVVPDYALLFFDHLYSEYVVIKPTLNDQELTGLLDAIHEKRLNCKLTWSDIYTFDLELVTVRPLENLIRKAHDARAKYRSIAGQKDYDEYIASNPPNLIEIRVEPNAQPPQPDVIMERKLRADLEHLLGKFYLYYAMLPARERLREELTKRALRTTVIWIVVLVALILFNLGTTYLLRWGEVGEGLTVLSVTMAGIIGGCVSMLQRIQSTPSEGDALFNLAALSNGWRGISLSPFYGGIFASLLFVLFAAGILKGSVFPEIHTPGKSVTSPTPSASPTPSPNPSSSASPTPSTSPTATPAATANAQTPNQKAGQETPSPTPSAAAPTPASNTGVLRTRRFLRETGPVDGTSYALLIIWSFLAGFAERLVPDTLNRLVAKNEALQGK